MILWTILPLEMVLDGIDKSPAYEEIEYAGVKAVVEKISAAQYRIVRIVTSDPQNYLRPEFQPGALLTYRPAYADLSGSPG
ncbi:Hypothetical protein LUCI_3292 [Lucifera butyrica]|uniref:YlzJ-like protein n=1 Tax=Lucifera butyrica TaxID=1351585 RepID=A0A498RAY4_9FIRM|nr:YlzJ-like family protein [Lucifera butyrica]VBB08027.1 Hypothetical protein LUCI_3292 [Lucifera butyrica]